MDAIYARITVKNNGNIEKQIELCKKEAGDKPAAVYVDDGFSGMSLERPELQKLINNIKKNNIKRVIVYSMDRLSRSTDDFEALVKLFKEYNVELVTVKEQPKIVALYDKVKVAREIQKYLDTIDEEDASYEY